MATGRILIGPFIESRHGQNTMNPESFIDYNAIYPNPAECLATWVLRWFFVVLLILVLADRFRKRGKRHEQ